MKKILIVGGLGFLQSNYIRYSCKDLKDKYSISSIDKCVDKSKVKSVYINKNHDFYIADINDKHISDVIFDIVRPDVVITPFIDYKSLNSTVELCKTYAVKQLIFINKSQDSLQIDFDNVCELIIPNLIGLRQSGLLQYITNYIIEKDNKAIHCNPMDQFNWLSVVDISNAINCVIDNELIGSFNINGNYQLSCLEIENMIKNVLLDHGTNVSNFNINFNKSAFRTSSANSNDLLNYGWKPEVKIKDAIYNSVTWILLNRWFYAN